MSYTLEDARAEVGESKDWELGRQASIKKWEQIAAGDEEAYDPIADCGMCFVCKNRGVDCFSAICPAYPICDAGVEFVEPQEVIDALKQLELPEGTRE